MVEKISWLCIRMLIDFEVAQSFSGKKTPKNQKE
jgi:hypothetical protein